VSAPVSQAVLASYLRLALAASGWLELAKDAFYLICSAECMEYH
jgi:hypothetical protein